MMLLSWNCRGLGNPGAVRELCQLVKDKKPTLLFLMETKSRQPTMEGIRVRLGFEGLFVVDPVGRSGGLALLWRESNALEIQNYTRRHINAVVKGADRNSQWFLTCFYGNPIPHRRFESWDLLSHLKTLCMGAWLVIRDFNEIVQQSEKCGGAQRRDGQMGLFQNVLGECGLSDLGFKGSKFTWSNGHQDGTYMKERLDRAVANWAWCGLFRNREVCVLPTITSDHTPLLLRTFGDNESYTRYYESFKFEAKWLADEECMGVIKEAWSMGGMSNCGGDGPLLALGVSKKTGKPEPEPENRETGNRETGVPVPVPVWKNQKPGTPVPVPGFWYSVFTGLPGTGLNIFFIYLFAFS
jgi:hypothetical protein